MYVSVGYGRPGHGPVAVYAFHPTDPPFFLDSSSLEHHPSPMYVSVGIPWIERVTVHPV